MFFDARLLQLDQLLLTPDRLPNWERTHLIVLALQLLSSTHLCMVLKIAFVQLRIVPKIVDLIIECMAIARYWNSLSICGEGFASQEVAGLLLIDLVLVAHVYALFL